MAIAEVPVGQFRRIQPLRGLRVEKEALGAVHAVKIPAAG